MRFLIDHDIHSGREICERAIVMKNGMLTGTVKVDGVSEADLPGRIILGKMPEHQAA